jgi:hypothetical protein
MEEWFIIESFYHVLIRLAWDHIDATAGGSIFALSIEEVCKLVEKMASNLSWNEERTLMKKLENSGLDHLKMVDS